MQCDGAPDCPICAAKLRERTFRAAYAARVLRFWRQFPPTAVPSAGPRHL